jgi:hypothetical protein
MCGSAETVSAAVNATAITVHGIVEPDIGTVVVSDDLSGVSFFEDFQFCFGRLAEPFN